MRRRRVSCEATLAVKVFEKLPMSVFAHTFLACALSPCFQPRVLKQKVISAVSFFQLGMATAKSPPVSRRTQ